MKKYLCGFYCEPLRWTVTAESEQEATRALAEYIKHNGITSASGVDEFVVSETTITSLNNTQKGVNDERKL